MTSARAFVTAGVLAVAAAVGVLQLRGLADDQDKKPQEHAHAGHGGPMEQCARACSDCQRSCESCSTHCARLASEGKADHLKTLQTCRDCADVCATAAGIVSRHGPFSDTICTACADACKRCGKACEAFSDDAHMKACADECRRCEKACRDMLHHAGHGNQAGAGEDREKR